MTQMPQSGAVLISVWPAPACAMPSPRLPISWSRKSENGKNVTSFSWEIELDPVVNAGRWQLTQPIAVNVMAPRLAWAIKGSGGGGARSVMNWVNCVIEGVRSGPLNWHQPADRLWGIGIWLCHAQRRRAFASGILPRDLPRLLRHRPDLGVPTIGCLVISGA
jgi:hypothetical protein